MAAKESTTTQAGDFSKDRIERILAEGRGEAHSPPIVSMAPPPPARIRRPSSGMPPKPTRVPLNWQMYCPTQLIPQTERIFTEAGRKFQVQTQITQLYKYLIHELTPHFCAALQARTLPANLALSSMSDLLTSFLADNCKGSWEYDRLKQEMIKSDEWMKFVVEVARFHSESFPPAVSNAGGKKGARTEIDAFIAKVTEEERKIIRKDIWIVAGYKDATEFQRFQKGHHRCTNNAKVAFKRVLSLTSNEFIQSLESKQKRK